MPAIKYAGIVLVAILTLTGCTPAGAPDPISGAGAAPAESTQCATLRAEVELACLIFVEAEGGVPACLCPDVVGATCELAVTIDEEGVGEALSGTPGTCTAVAAAGAACCDCTDYVDCIE